MIQQMKLTDVGCDEATVARYIEDDMWVMQQKFDGTRSMLHMDLVTGQLSWGNGSHSAAKLKHGALEEILRPAVERLSAERPDAHSIYIDGELLIRTGEYLMWDLLIAGEGAYNEFGTWEQRRANLETFHMLHLQGQNLAKLTPTAHSKLDKLAMWTEINRTNVEGAISKHRQSLFIPGIRTKDWVKHKLVKTADLVVIEATRVFKANGHTVERGSCRLGYMGSDGEIKPICSSSLIGKDLTIDVGDVVEVSYLYRETGGGGLVQPRIMRKRWDARTSDGDKSPEACTEDQFPEYSREVVTF